MNATYSYVGVNGTGVVLLASGSVTNGGPLFLGRSAGGDGTIRVIGGLWQNGTATMTIGDASRGRVQLGGGEFEDRGDVYLGGSTGADGLLEITNGIWRQSGGVRVGYLNSGLGTFNLSGGVFSNSGPLFVGYYNTARGFMSVSGGNWEQLGLVTVGRGSATGVLIIAGTVVTNRGGITVGGNDGGAGAATTNRGEMVVRNGEWTTTNAVIIGATTGGRNTGLLSVSNGIFQGLASVTIDQGAGASGYVDLQGTQRLFRVGTLSLGDMGYITNHVARYAGGVDITNSASASLAIANGGKIYLSFEGDPKAVGSFWGLRWAGDHLTDLATFTNASPKKLAWDDSALSPGYQGKITVYKDATYTYVGFDAKMASGALFLVR